MAVAVDAVPKAYAVPKGFAVPKAYAVPKGFNRSDQTANGTTTTPPSHLAH